MVAGAAASCGVLNIQNQESAENDRVAPLMICVRSSFDSRAAVETLPGHKIRATQSFSQILRFCLNRTSQEAAAPATTREPPGGTFRN